MVSRQHFRSLRQILFIQRSILKWTLLLSFNALILFLKESSTLIRCIIWHKERTWETKMQTDQWWSLSMYSALSEIQCYIQTYYLQFVVVVVVVVVVVFRRLNLPWSLSGPCMMHRMLFHFLVEHGIRFKQWGIECSAKVLALWTSTLAIQHHAYPIMR